MPGDDLVVDRILELFDEVHGHEPDDPTEGLRERKKRRLRQRISDVATAMFLVEGFEHVTVARIAAACEVSEQTVFNYFPTKESMFLDRSDAMIEAVADAVRDRGNGPLGDAVARALTGVTFDVSWGAVDRDQLLHLFRLFGEAATGSPALAAARAADFERFTDAVSAALAERVGAQPGDPEVQLVTMVIAAIARIRLNAGFHHVHHVASLDDLAGLVQEDLDRAVRLAEPTLSAFDAR